MSQFQRFYLLGAIVHVVDDAWVELTNLLVGVPLMEELSLVGSPNGVQSVLSIGSASLLGLPSEVSVEV